MKKEEKQHVEELEDNQEKEIMPKILKLNVRDSFIQLKLKYREQVYEGILLKQGNP